MTTFLLIRHGLNDWMGRAIAGRTPGVHLNEAGRGQAEKLADFVAGTYCVDGIFSSPLERARETAEPLVQRLNMPAQLADELLEIDFGQWMGRSLEELRELEEWHRFNRFRSAAGIPGGETMLEVQGRMVGLLIRLAAERPSQTLCMFGHGDPIKTALAHFMGISLDLYMRIEISAASVSVLEVGRDGPRILCVNRTL